MTGDHVEGKFGDTEYGTWRLETAVGGRPDSEQERRALTVGTMHIQLRLHASLSLP